MFRAGLMLIIRRINCVQTAIGIVMRCVYCTNCSLYIVDPPDDEQQGSSSSSNRASSSSSSSSRQQQQQQQQQLIIRRSTLYKQQLV
jgi:hypothetical protein